MKITYKNKRLCCCISTCLVVAGLLSCNSKAKAQVESDIPTLVQAVENGAQGWTCYLGCKNYQWELYSYGTAHGIPARIVKLSFDKGVNPDPLIYKRVCTYIYYTDESATAGRLSEITASTAEPGCKSGHVEGSQTFLFKNAPLEAGYTGKVPSFD
jgi:hypothetical protein